MRPRFLLAIALLALASCGDDATTSERPSVFAASSLRDVLPQIVPGATFNFAGSNELLTQLERGAKADILAAAGPKEPQALARDGRCKGTPAFYATNALAIEPCAPGLFSTTTGLPASLASCSL